MVTSQCAFVNATYDRYARCSAAGGAAPRRTNRLMLYDGGRILLPRNAAWLRSRCVLSVRVSTRYGVANSILSLTVVHHDATSRLWWRGCSGVVSSVRNLQPRSAEDPLTRCSGDSPPFSTNDNAGPRAQPALQTLSTLRISNASIDRAWVPSNPPGVHARAPCEPCTSKRQTSGSAAATGHGHEGEMLLQDPLLPLLEQPCGVAARTAEHLDASRSSSVCEPVLLCPDTARGAAT
ncbi:hypothetical protein C8Q73DRAFT_148980 [Cubamyces lactineus]|nr:hypothetical protein C8Q73DRAFT_148980 [Cubamyces lactineus]